MPTQRAAHHVVRVSEQSPGPLGGVRHTYTHTHIHTPERIQQEMKDERERGYIIYRSRRQRPTVVTAT